MTIVETTLISLDGQVQDPMSFAAPYFDAGVVVLTYRTQG